jgi:hypothetical protein
MDASKTTSAVEDPLGSSPPPLQLHDPLGRLPRDVEPQTAPLQVNGIPCLLTHWTPREWHRLAPEQRPPNAFMGSRGDRYALDPDTAAGPASSPPND